jgi:inorganic pyrophosphatase
VRTPKSDHRQTSNGGSTDFEALPTRDRAGHVHVVVETPRGSSVKIAWDPELRVFAYGRQLSAGLSFPFDFGFVPRTKAGDGDPLDALVLHEGASYPGVLIACRLVGLIRVGQSERGKRVRNDRVVAVPTEDARVGSGYAGRALSSRNRAELEEFFRAAVLFEGKHVTLLGWGGAKEAERWVDRLARAHHASR